MKKDAGGGTIIILLVILAAWCPWLSQTDALNIYRLKTDEARQSSPACAFQLDEGSIHKVLFGYMAKVKYDCTIADIPSLTTGENNVFLTFFKMDVNMPHPVIR